MKRQAPKPHVPLVSVCITSLNYGHYLGEAIASALQQSYPNIEVVVSDNGSTDNTFDVLATYRGDARVRVFLNGETISMAANHNAVIARAKGEYIVVLSADDLLLPHHVATLMARIQDPRDPVDIAMGQATYCDSRLTPIGTPFSYGMLPVDYSLRDEFASMIISYSQMLPAKIVRREIYEKLGFFDETIARAFDVDFALRVEMAGYRVAFVHEVVAVLRMHRENATTEQINNLVGYHHDKLAYLDKLVVPENAWRFEYIGKLVANIVENERAIIPGDELDHDTLIHSESMAMRLRKFSDERHEWPQDRPRVTVVVHTHGATRPLLATLDGLCAQEFKDIEILVIQTKGVGLRALLQTRPYAHLVRHVSAPHVTNAGGALRLGFELARAPYVTFLEEGQTTPQDHLASLVRGIEDDGVDFVYSDSSSIQMVHEMTSSGEEGHTPCVPVQRGEILPRAGSLSFSQTLIRRNLLLGGGLIEHIDQVSEQEFIEAMKFHFQYVYFERRAITEFVIGSTGQ